MKHRARLALLISVGLLAGGYNRAGIADSDHAVTANQGESARRQLSRTAEQDIQGLTAAASRGDTATAKRLLDRGVDPNARTPGVDTPMMKAATEGHASIVQLLVGRGADPNARGWDSRTALMSAAASGRVAIVNLLLAAGADVNARDKWGESGFTLAGFFSHIDIMELLLVNGARVTSLEYGETMARPASEGRMDVVQYLIEKGADLNAKDRFGQTALASAAGNGHINIVRLLLDKGADVNANGGGALLSAACGGHIELVNLLLARGADVNARRDDGVTALTCVASGSRTDILELLLDRGADANAKSKGSDWTPLMMAARYADNGDTVRALLKKGADLNALDSHVDTALMIAAGLGHAEVVKALIAGGASVNRASKVDGATPLIAAAACGRLETVRALLAAGANVNAKVHDGSNALIYAAGELVLPPGSPQYVSSGDAAKNYNHDGVVKTLLAAGADVNASDGNGATALMRAAGRGRATAIKFLLEAGANVNARDEYGKTALMLASEAGHTDVVKLLKQAEILK